MELAKFKEFDTKYLEQWFADTVDIINYNTTKTQEVVGGLDKKLTSLDTVPFDELKDFFNNFIDHINDSFDKIMDAHKVLETKLNKLGG